MIRIITSLFLVLLVSAEALAERDHTFTPIPMGPGGNRLPQPGARAETNELPGLEGNPSKFLQMTKGRVTAENLSKGLQDLRTATGGDFKRESDEFAGMIGNTPNGLALLQNGGNINPQSLLNAFCLGQLNPSDLDTLADSFKRIAEAKGLLKSGEEGTSAPRVSATRDREPASNEKSGVSPPRSSSTKRFEKTDAKSEVSEDPISPPRKSAADRVTRSSNDEVSPPRPSSNGEGTGGGSGAADGGAPGTEKEGGVGGNGAGNPNDFFDPNNCPPDPNVFDDGLGNNVEALNRDANKRPPGQGGPGNGGDPSGGGGGGGFPPIGGGQIPGSPERDDPKAPPAAQIAPMPKLSLAPPVPEGANLLGLIAAAGAVQFQFTGLGDAVQRMTAEFIARINASAAGVFPNGNLPQQMMQPSPAARPATNIRSLLQNSTTKRSSNRGVSR